MRKKIKTGLLAYFLFPIAASSRGLVLSKFQRTEPSSLADTILPRITGMEPGNKDADNPTADSLSSDSSGNRQTGRKNSPKVAFGVASYYSNKFEGRKTYTDEIFSQKKLTAASNTVPMHTWVRVTNLRNNKSVIVRINDKMHPRNKRLIDLSRAAAVRLGYAGRGLTRVKVEVLGRKRPPEVVNELADSKKK